jgi:hypothetical protein
MIPYGAISESRNSYLCAEPNMEGSAAFALALFCIGMVMVILDNGLLQFTLVYVTWR